MKNLNNKVTLKPNEPKSYSFEQVHDLSYFSEIIFSKNIISHHFPHYYEEALDAENLTFL